MLTPKRNKEWPAWDIEALFRKRLLICMLPGMLFIAVFLFRSKGNLNGRFTLFDDAMISMAYGRTLANTGEWVWFPGGDRVQGFTNPLWTLWMAFLHRIGLEGSTAAFAVSITGFVLVLGCALVSAMVIRLSLPPSEHRDWAAAIGAGTILFDYPIVFWSLRGMEVGLLALLTILGVAGLLWLRQRWENSDPEFGPLTLLTLVGVLGILTRLDFAVFIAALGLMGIFWAPNLHKRILLTLAVGFPLILTIALLLVFQQRYFGDYLTNTYRLKMEGFNTGMRLQRGIVSAAKNLPLLLLIALSILSTQRAKPPAYIRKAIYAPALIWATSIAYSIWVGGDAWEWANMANRYVAVGTPAAVAVIFIGFNCLLRGAPLPRHVLLGSLGVFVISGFGFAAATNPFGFIVKTGMESSICLLVAAVCLYVALTRYWKSPSNRRAVFALLAGGFTVVCATSAIAGAIWIRDGGVHVQGDAQFASLSLEVQAATDPEAVIATVSAGAPGYYSNRRMVDLLGKSDRIIAAMEPGIAPPARGYSTFWPGHNKWNYDYSIGELRPDVLLQIWFQTEDNLLKLSKWGYVKLCWSDGITASYFLVDSPHINFDQLHNCASNSNPN